MVVLNFCPNLHVLTDDCALCILLLPGAVELVPHLPPHLGLWRHPHPHARRQDGGALQTWLRPAQRLPRPASARLVHDGHVAQAGLLPDAVRQAGEAGRREADIRVYTAVDDVTGSAGGAGAQYLSWEEGGLREATSCCITSQHESSHQERTVVKAAQVKLWKLLCVSISVDDELRCDLEAQRESNHCLRLWTLRPRKRLHAKIRTDVW